MSIAFRTERHEIALRLEKEIIGMELSQNPYAPQPKGRVERAIGRFLRFEFDEAEFRRLLQSIADGAKA
ncbi:MAG: hypothetical protein ACRDBL_09240 [Rhabdaerophilum sp.]